jgi:hypothetical protein
MVAVSPFFATTRLLNEIRSIRARAEDSRPESTVPTAKREDTAHTSKPQRKPK